MAEEEEKEEDAERESEGETPAGNDDGSDENVAGSMAAAASSDYAAVVASAKTALLAYTEPSDEFKCTPNAKTRPTRKLDYISPPGSSPWPTNCAGREDLCDVVAKTAGAWLHPRAAYISPAVASISHTSASDCSA